MKKRLICCVIVLALCLSVFAGCATAFSYDDLTMVLQNLERDVRAITGVTPVSYEVPRVLGEEQNVTDAKGNPATIYVAWEKEGSSLITLTKSDDGTKIKVNVPESADNIDYTLKATLVNAKGKAYLDSNKKTYSATFICKTKGSSPDNPNNPNNPENPNNPDNPDNPNNPSTPTEGNGTQSSPYTVAQALGVISGLGYQEWSGEVYVKGVVSGSMTTGKDSGDWKFDIVDAGSSDKLTVYYAKPLSSVSGVSDGDTVVVSGSLTDYGGTKEISSKKDGTVTCRMVSVTPGTGSGNTGGNQGGNQGGGEVSGNTLTITFANQGYTDTAEPSNVTSNGITIAFGQGNATKETPKWYDNGNAVRLYGGNTMTISGKTITKVVITFGSGEKNSNAISANVGTMSTDTWTGSTNNLVLTIDGTSGHRRIASIAITFAD